MRRSIYTPCPRRRKRSWISSFSASSERTKMTWADTSREKFHITLSSPVYRPLRISFPFFSFYCRRCTLFFFFFFLPFVSTQHANNFAINSCFARNMHPFQTWIFTPTSVLKLFSGPFTRDVCSPSGSFQVKREGRVVVYGIKLEKLKIILFSVDRSMLTMGSY